MQKEAFQVDFRSENRDQERNVVWKREILNVKKRVYSSNTPHP